MEELKGWGSREKPEVLTYLPPSQAAMLPALWLAGPASHQARSAGLLLGNGSRCTTDKEEEAGTDTAYPDRQRTGGRLASKPPIDASCHCSSISEPL